MSIVSVDASHQVITDSPWIDQMHLRQLTAWLPMIGDFEDKYCLSFLNLNEKLCVLCGSVFSAGRRIGSPSQVVTQVLPFRKQLLGNYFGNPALLAYYCLSNGLLSRDDVDSISELNNEIVFDPNRWAKEFDIGQLKEIGRSIALHGRAVVFKSGNPIKLIASLYSTIEDGEGPLNFSFGAKLTQRLPFQLQICHEMDPRTKSLLASQAIRHFQARDVVEVA